MRPGPAGPLLRLAFPLLCAAPLWAAAAFAAQRSALAARLLAQAGILVVGAAFLLVPVLRPGMLPVQRFLGAALVASSLVQLAILLLR